MGRPKGAKNQTDDLRAFAQRIERHVLSAKLKDMESMELLICRLLTGNKNPAIAAMLAQRWVEWRYGKAAQVIVGDKDQPIEHVCKVIHVGN